MPTFYEGSGISRGYMRQVNGGYVAESAVLTKCIELTTDLVDDFVSWNRMQGTSENMLYRYLLYLRKVVGLKLCRKKDVMKYFGKVGLSKTSYEAFSRLLTYIEKRFEGYEELAYRLRKALPRKPRTKADTYIPSDSEILKLKENLAKEREPYVTIYNILVSSGCRLSEAMELLKTFNTTRLVRISENIYRYHLDFQRKSKNILILYLPKKVVKQIMDLKKRNIKLPHIDTVEDKFKEAGLNVKYIRKWFRQTLKKLRIDSETIEFLQGRKSALGIGGKHYTDFIPLADETCNIFIKTIANFLV